MQPIFDNDALLEKDFILTPHRNTEVDYSLKFDESLEKIVTEFITVSAPEYIEKIKNKLPLISEDNIIKILKKIETRTFSPLPLNIKEKILTNFKTIRKIINTSLINYEENKKTR